MFNSDITTKPMIAWRKTRYRFCSIKVLNVLFILRITSFNAKKLLFIGAKLVIILYFCNRFRVYARRTNANH